MDRLAAATIVAKSYISYARVLAASFREHHPDIPFFVLLADEVEGMFDPAEEQFELLCLDDMPVDRPESFRFNYTMQELSYACTPYLLAALLDRGFRSAAFFKQESLVLDDLTPVFAEMERHPVSLTPHLLEPLTGKDAADRELNILQSGIFNVGFLGVSESETARRFLSWWQDRVFWHCRHDVAGGMHFEQRWLDLAPVYFEGAHFIRDAGFNLGHWNLPERNVRRTDGGLTAAGRRLRFMRFSGFDPDRPDQVTRYHGRLAMGDIGTAADLFRLYSSLMSEAGYGETKRWPYAYSGFDNSVIIPDVARRIYRDSGERTSRFGDPFMTGHSQSFFNWLLKPADGGEISSATRGGAREGGAFVTNIWKGVYERRPDVRAAFPDVFGSGPEKCPSPAAGQAFLEWAERHGMKEHGIPEPFHPARLQSG